GGGGFLGGEKAPGQRNLFAKRAGAAEMKQRPVARGAKPARRLGQLKAGAGGSDDEVAFEREAKPQSQDIAVHRGDDRFPVDRAGEEIGRVGAPALRPAELFEFVAASELALADIGAAAKGAAVAIEDRHLCLGVEIKAA